MTSAEIGDGLLYGLLLPVGIVVALGAAVLGLRRLLTGRWSGKRR
jgi:hypothetical protein